MGNEDNAGERMLGEVAKYSEEYLVREEVSEVGGGGSGSGVGRHRDDSRESKYRIRRTTLVDLDCHCCIRR